MCVAFQYENGILYGISPNVNMEVTSHALSQEFQECYINTALNMSPLSTESQCLCLFTEASI